MKRVIFGAMALVSAALAKDANSTTFNSIHRSGGMTDNRHPVGCVFPFTYKGVDNYSCSSQDVKGFTWCAHNKEYLKGKEGVTWETCPEPLILKGMNMTAIMSNYQDYAQKNITKLDCIEPADKINKGYQVKAKTIDKDFKANMNSKTSATVKSAAQNISNNIDTYIIAEAKAKAILDAAIKKAQATYAAIELEARLLHEKEEKTINQQIDYWMGNILKKRTAGLMKINDQITKYYMPWEQGCRASRQMFKDKPLFTEAKGTPAWLIQKVEKKLVSLNQGRTLKLWKKNKARLLAWVIKQKWTPAQLSKATWGPGARLPDKIFYFVQKPNKGTVGCMIDARFGQAKCGTFESNRLNTPTFYKPIIQVDKWNLSESGN